MLYSSSMKTDSLLSLCGSRLIKDFERVSKDEVGRTDPETAKMLHDRKQSMVLLLYIVPIYVNLYTLVWSSNFH